MRRSSFTGVASGGSHGEPLIVVEESGGIIEEEEEEDESKNSSPDRSQAVNDYLLTPYRDLRKRSLPTPPCTSGITASQVRRLSERGGEGSGPSPIEQAFLATLSQAPAPQPGARRHSVVTISRAPPTSTLFGRNRRESIAAFASGLPGLSRRDSGTFQSRGSLSGQGSQSGSSFNLALDIMDDIADVKAKAKTKRKASWTPGPSIDESQKGAPRRRASELPSLSFSPAGIVCSNTDLESLLSPVKSSASDSIEKEVRTCSPTHKSIIDKKRNFLRDRSSSFDLPGPASNWFTRRNQVENKDEPKDIVVTFVDEKTKSSVVPCSSDAPKSEKSNKVLWDDKTGAVIDVNLIGNAIEGFLNRRSSQSAETPKQSPTKLPKSLKIPWFAHSKEENHTEPGSDSCESSIFSTLKDLFVK